MRKTLCAVSVIVALSSIVSVPLYSQGNSGRIWIGVPIYASYQFSFEELEAVQFSAVQNALRRADLNVALQVFFPVAGGISIGPEVGVSYPPAVIVAAITDKSYEELTNVVHIPIRLVLDIALTNSVKLDVLIGTEINIWKPISESLAGAINFDIGARVDISGFLIDASYTLPFSVNVTESISTSQAGEWQNAVTLGLGYRISL